VRSAPVIELLEPRNQSVVRPGTLLRWRITDIHGVGSVVAREGAGLYELEQPYALSTSGWGEGVHALEVTARNRYGNPTLASYVFTLDGTPPLLRDLSVAPARPGPGQEFQVEARTSRDALVAVVQVLKDGSLLREVPATVGLGLLTANLSLPEGRYTLAVQVEDQAGNSATADAPLEVGAGLPGPEVGALALALGLAALRRRRAG
jgi:hypothetical protein